MASTQIAVTLRPEEIEFLRDKNLSPTQLLKEKIHDIQAQYIHVDANLKDIKRKLDAWTKTADQLRAFIERKGLIDDYLNEIMKTNI